MVSLYPRGNENEVLSLRVGTESIGRTARALLWLTAFSSTLDVVAIGVVGNTPLLLTPVCAGLYVAHELLKKRGRLRVGRSWSNLFLVAYTFYAIMSVLLAYPVGLDDAILRAFAGLAVLGTQLLVYASTVINPSELRLRTIVSGLLVGAGVNSAYGIYQFIGSYHGLPLITLPGFVRAANVLLLHRAQGFFREPSHFAALLVPMLLVSLGIGGRRWFLVAGSMITALVLSFSSGALFAVVGVLIYFMVESAAVVLSGRTPRSLAVRIAAVGILTALAFTVLLYAMPGTMARVQDIVAGGNPLAKENIGRTVAIQRGFVLGLAHPFGVGYNLGPTLMARQVGQTNIHSLLIEILLDTGFPGLLLFVMFILSLSLPLFGRDHSCRLLGVAVITSTLYSFATYNGLFYFQWVLWGTAELVAGRKRCVIDHCCPKKGVLEHSL